MNRTLSRLLPRDLYVLAAEISGFCSVQDAGPAHGVRAALARCRSLLAGSSATARHALFDPRYYLETNPDVRASFWPPLLHFLVWGGFEGRSPHPLFDPDWYLARYPDVAQSRLNPLQHYVRFGRYESRSPHPLFDAPWYLRSYPDIQSVAGDPLLHYLTRGAAEGRQPHPLFDTAWYVRSYPQVGQSGLNPLVHYLLHGGKQGLNPNRHFNARQYLESNPSLDSSGLSPLAHYVLGLGSITYNPHPGYPRPARPQGRRTQGLPSRPEILRLSTRKPPARTAPVLSNSVTGSEIPVFVVYGQGNIPFIESQLIPALAQQHCSLPVHLHTLHYRDSRCLLSPAVLNASRGALAGVTDWSASRESRHIGFGESVNYLFARVAPPSCFLLVNPDSAPLAGCLDRLLQRFSGSDAAIVEARQWPSEHPKEYDPGTGYTPWATGAFLLISATAFTRLEGFDPIYFLYNEDVDLSWRAWLGGMPVVYEPGAMCAHYTGAFSYRTSRFYPEHFFSLRNFVVIAYKFFGEKGERAAWRWIEEARLPAALHARIESSYRDLRGRIQPVTAAPHAIYADQVKIVGLNLYHQLRQV